MAEIKQSALELIGGTPLLKLNGYSKKAGVTDDYPSNQAVYASQEYVAASHARLASDAAAYGLSGGCLQPAI